MVSKTILTRARTLGTCSCVKQWCELGLSISLLVPQPWLFKITKMFSGLLAKTTQAVHISLETRVYLNVFMQEIHSYVLTKGLCINGFNWLKFYFFLLSFLSILSVLQRLFDTIYNYVLLSMFIHVCILHHSLWNINWQFNQFIHNCIHTLDGPFHYYTVYPFFSRVKKFVKMLKICGIFNLRKSFFTILKAPYTTGYNLYLLNILRFERNRENKSI